MMLLYLEKRNKKNKNTKGKKTGGAENKNQFK